MNATSSSHPIPSAERVSAGSLDDLAGLVHAIRRLVVAAPPGVWSEEDLEAASQLTAALSETLHQAVEERLDDGCFRVEPGADGLKVVEVLHHLDHDRRLDIVPISSPEAARQLIESWRSCHNSYYHQQ